MQTGRECNGQIKTGRWFDPLITQFVCLQGFKILWSAKQSVPLKNEMLLCGRCFRSPPAANGSVVHELILLHVWLQHTGLLAPRNSDCVTAYLKAPAAAAVPKKFSIAWTHLPTECMLISTGIHITTNCKHDFHACLFSDGLMASLVVGQFNDRV